MSDGGASFDVKEELQEAILYINSNLLKICIKNQTNIQNTSGNLFGPNRFGNNVSHHENTISFKYTVDYPKIELHPFDTKKFSILFNNTES